MFYIYKRQEIGVIDPISLSRTVHSVRFFQLSRYCCCRCRYVFPRLCDPRSYVIPWIVAILPKSL